MQKHKETTWLIMAFLYAILFIFFRDIIFFIGMWGSIILGAIFSQNISATVNLSISADKDGKIGYCKKCFKEE